MKLLISSGGKCHRKTRKRTIWQLYKWTLERRKSMKGVDTLERFIETHEKYGDSPMYTTLNEYIDNELIVLEMQIENLRLKLQDILNN